MAASVVNARIFRPPLVRRGTDLVAWVRSTVLIETRLPSGVVCVVDEQGRQYGRDHTTICVEEEPAYERCKTVYAHRERETQKYLS